jgi:hypothetical protein
MRRVPVPWRLALAAALLLASPARAEDGPPPAEVSRAIDAGVAWLERTFADGYQDERWHDPVELVVLALSHSGANLQSPAFAKGLAVLEKAEPRFTYRAALLAMALAEVNPRRYQPKIAHCAQWLVDTQLAGGEWGYPGAPAGKDRRPEGIRVEPPPAPEPAEPGASPSEDEPPPEERRGRLVIERRVPVASYEGMKGDFSNTQFALLGLRACRDAGVEVPQAAWKGALDYLRKYQQADGGWGYVMTGAQDEASYASLTFAGACSAALCLHALGSKDPKSEGIVKKALAWANKNYDPTQNVGIDLSVVIGPSPWQYYHLYSLERAARVLGLAQVRGKPWYGPGAQWLLAAQQSDGRWEDAAGPGAAARPRYLTVADTCFALLFLTRATRPLTK